ncbi:MAG: ATP-binding protein [Alphaproteobacteria bacterium]
MSARADGMLEASADPGGGMRRRNAPAIFWRRLKRGRVDIGLLIKPFMPRDLLWRSLLIIILPFSLALVVITIIFFELHWDKVTGRLAAGVAGDIASIIDSTEDFTDEAEFAALSDRANRYMRLYLRYVPGEALPRKQPSAFFSAADRTLRRELERKLSHPFWFDTTRYPNHVDIRVQLEEGVLRVIAVRPRVFATSGYIFVIWMTGSLLLLFGIAILFLLNQVRSIIRLAHAAEQFGKGRDVPEFKPSGAREVRQAAASFLLMKDRIQRHIQQRTDMLAGVSHDLRTPLTRLKLQLAMMEGEDAAAMREDITQMERMLDEYLAFARGEEGEKTEWTELAPLLGELAEACEKQGLKVDLQCTEALALPVRPNAFRRALTNLLDNARAHAETVHIRTEHRDSLLEIRIEDDGPGIPEDQREEAFRPFHRLEDGRNLDKGGVGLGLAIARDIIRGHGGEIVLGQSELGGLAAVLRMPV